MGAIYIVKKTDNVPSWLLLFYQSLDVNSCALGHMIYDCAKMS